MSRCRTPVEKKEKEQIRKAIEAYLLAEVRGGKHYFKACDVADSTEIPIRVVGSNIGLLKKESSCLTIVRWSGSSSTVWRITEKIEAASSDRSRESSDASEVRLTITADE